MKRPQGPWGPPAPEQPAWVSLVLHCPSCSPGHHLLIGTPAPEPFASLGVKWARPHPLDHLLELPPACRRIPRRPLMPAKRSAPSDTLDSIRWTSPAAQPDRPADFLLSNPATSARQKSRCQTIAPPLGMTLWSTTTPRKPPLRDTVVSDPLRDTKSGKTADYAISIYVSQLVHLHTEKVFSAVLRPISENSPSNQ